MTGFGCRNHPRTEAGAEVELLPRGANQVTNAEAIKVSALRRAPDLGTLGLELGRELALTRADGLAQLLPPKPIQPLVEQGLLDVLNPRAVDSIEHWAFAADDVDADNRAGGLEEIEILLR